MNNEFCTKHCKRKVLNFKFERSSKYASDKFGANFVNLSAIINDLHKCFRISFGVICNRVYVNLAYHVRRQLKALVRENKNEDLKRSV